MEKQRGGVQMHEQAEEKPENTRTQNFSEFDLQVWQPYSFTAKTF